MKVCDFVRSFIRFRLDTESKQQTTVSHKPPFTVNNVRIPLECRCELTDPQTDTSVQYVLGSSCKTERVNVKEDIWFQPVADFSPVFSSQDFLCIKSWDKCDKQVQLYPPSLGFQPERQVGKLSEAFDCAGFDVQMIEGKELSSTEEIVKATLENLPLVGRTEFDTSSGQHVLLEYPIKTINVSERDGFYQTDTGPVLFPDLSDNSINPIESFRLAYVAYNSANWAEFIINVPTPIAEGISVNHYSQAKRLDCKNVVIEY